MPRPYESMPMRARIIRLEFRHRESAGPGADGRGVLRAAEIFRSCICRRYSAPGAGYVAVIIARTTMTHATNSQGGSMAARKKAAKRGKKAAKRGAKKAAKKGKKKAKK